MKWFFSLSFVALSFLSVGQEEDEYVQLKKLRFENARYEDQIKTAMLYRKGAEGTFPVLRMGSADQLELVFDDLNGELTDYTVTFIHCDHEWQPDDLDYMEYVNGIDNIYITDYEFSTNTRQKYVHYEFSFPNEECRFLLSGNYLMVVYREEDRSDLILSKRFMITENTIAVDADIHPATQAEDRFTKQEIDFNIKYADGALTEVYSNLHVVLIKNRRWDNVLTGLQPQFVKQNELVYDYEDGNVFWGGAEYRFFDTRASSMTGPKVGRVFLRNDSNIVFLNLGTRKNIRAYVNDLDLNGGLRIKVYDDMFNASTDADYHLTYFAIEQPLPFEGGDVYLMGDWNSKQIEEEYKMMYDEEKQLYKGAFYFKQGYYNYQYVFVPEGSSVGNESKMEGTHARTENEYGILVYYKRIQDDFERLIFYRSYRINN